MKRYKKILVPLELGDGDAEVIAWAGVVTRLAGTTEVEFMHVVEVPDIPQEAKEKYPWLMAPLDGMLQEEMEKRVKRHWKGREASELRFRVATEGNVVMSVLKAILDQECDLVVVAREAFGEELAVRLARKAPCSVMSVPLNSKVNLERIVVPTDFSRYSREALDVALAFAEAGDIGSITSLHIYDIGKFSHRVSLPKEELMDLAESFAEEKHGKFLENMDKRGIRVDPVNTFHQATSAGILKAIRELGGDLVVTGCRGRDTVTAWLLGGNAEELLKNAPVPVVAAKAKGTGQKMLEALLQG